MVKKTQNRNKPTRAMRIIYSTLGLSLIGSAVAVLGAPIKW
jgi:FtsH-binding integral membrane protein